MPKLADGEFLIQTEMGKNLLYFQGNLSSFIDRQVYLLGNYEQGYINAFLAQVRVNKRGVILDIGANVGTHSLSFSNHFEKVHAFEPNREVWASYERNMRINAIENCVLHRFGLGEKDDELIFHNVEGDNRGMGTFSDLDQYDVPLKGVGKAIIKNGDSFLAIANIERVDAIKIDVQGFEPEVLRGLKSTIARDRPAVWFELAGGTKTKVDTIEDLNQFFPYEIQLYRFVSKRISLRSRSYLIPHQNSHLPVGNYVVMVKDS